MGQFADIRPYNDSEVSAVIQNLLADDELMVAIASLKLGPWHKAFTWLIYPLIRLVLRRQLKPVRTVADFQMIVKRYMDSMITNSSEGFTVSGLDQLDPGLNYLFMSNHRDITLDPALVNYSLYQNGHDTVRIAIGDNLLTKPYVSDLMRINKSFIVNRSATGPRQLLAIYKKLSAYMHHSITVDHASIWIAQRQGRAKDGVDRTEAAVIKMVAMSQDRKKEQFSDFINRLNIVPVAISYELDPCDQAKAAELYETAVTGQYDKDEQEDVQSIAKGITGNKGHVHVSFGKPLSGDFEDADAVAREIDRQVVSSYLLHPTNFFAYKMLHGDYPADFEFNSAQFAAQEQAFQARVEAAPKEHREYLLGIYANAIESKRQVSA
jgi:Acyltransferase